MSKVHCAQCGKPLQTTYDTREGTRANILQESECTRVTIWFCPQGPCCADGMRDFACIARREKERIAAEEKAGA